MNFAPLRSLLITVAAVLLLATAFPGEAEAQLPERDRHPYDQVISANPFGILLGFFNAEFERIVTVSSTAGANGSSISFDDVRYTNFDVFWRFYPSGVPLNGWAFGAMTGVTTVTDEGTYVGFGFDVNRSWLMGAHDNFYIGLGVGLKRILGSPDEVDRKFIPTVRLVNVGFAF